MALNKYKLGELIEQRREKYDGSDIPVKGVSKDGLINPKQKVDDKSLYNLFYKKDFIFNPARMEINSIALNMEINKGTCSSLYEIFYIKDENIILPEYLNLFLKRDQFAKMCEFYSWGSAREYFRCANFNDIEIQLPPIEIQKKYVNIYNAMVENQKIYEYGLEDLKRVADIYIENLPKETYKPIGDFIARNIKRNDKELFSKKDVKGFNNEGEFIKPMRLFSGDISTFKIIDTGDFVYNSRINSNIKKLSIAMNQGKGLIVSPAYESFYITDKDKLYPSYLYMLLQRDSFARKVLFNSYGSSTLVFGISDLKEIKIPLPNFETQKSIADIYMIYKNRWQINEQIKEQIRKLCPILIKGSLEEAQN